MTDIQWPSNDAQDGDVGLLLVNARKVPLVEFRGECLRPTLSRWQRTFRALTPWKMRTWVFVVTIGAQR